MSANHYSFDDKVNPVNGSASDNFPMNSADGMKSIYELSAIVVDELKFISCLKDYNLNKNFIFNDDNGGAYHVKSLIKISYDYAIEVSSNILLQSKQIAHFKLQTLIEQMYFQFKMKFAQELNRAGKYFEHVFQKAVIYLESQKRQATSDIRRNYVGSPHLHSPQFSGEQRNPTRSNQPTAPTIQQFRISSPQMQQNPYQFQPQYPVAQVFSHPNQSQTSFIQVPMDPQHQEVQSQQYGQHYVAPPAYNMSPVPGYQQTPKQPMNQPVNYLPRAVQTQPQHTPIVQNNVHAGSSQTAERLTSNVQITNKPALRLMVVDERTLRVQQQSPSVTSTLSPMVSLFPNTHEKPAHDAIRPPISDNTQVKAVNQQPNAVAIDTFPEIIPQNDDDKKKKETDGKIASNELIRSPKNVGENDCSLLPKCLAKFNENSKRDSSNLAEENADKAATPRKKLHMNERSGKISAGKGDEPKSQAPEKEATISPEAIRIPSIPSLESLLSAPVIPVAAITQLKLMRPLFSPVEIDSRDNKADVLREIEKIKKETQSAQPTTVKRAEGTVDLTDSDSEVELIIDTESEIPIERKFVSRN